MKFLILSGNGQGLGLGFRLKQEGHDVVVHTLGKRRDYDGILRKVDKYDKVLTPDTTVVFDSIGGGRTAERLRGQGYHVVGGSMFADSLGDPDMALGLMEEAGIEAKDLDGPATHGWFDGSNFSQPLTHYISRERLMNDDLGPVSHAGAAMWTGCPCHPALERMSGILRYHGFRGPITLSSRGFTFDIPPAFFGLLKGEVGDTLDRFARGEAMPQLPLSGYSISTRVSHPDKPNGASGKEDVVPVRGLFREDRPSTYFHNVRLTEEGNLVASGPTVLDVLGNGKDLQEASTNMLGVLQRVDLPDKMYRTDLSASFEKDLFAHQESLSQRDHPPSPAPQLSREAQVSGTVH